MTSLTQKFVKTYEAKNDGKFKYTTMVSHKGTVIAFAMDDLRRIYYTVLDMERSDVESPIDVEYWNLEPTELAFPKEIASVGYSAAGTRQMPSVILAGTEGLGEEIDPFLSSTACLSADAPFQVISDNKHIYVFRQADTHNFVDPKQPFFVDTDGNSLELMQETLLLDRFVYVGGQLKNKLEIRYQRSRQKDLPASRKDALGYEDLEKNEFYEPTQQLSFVRNLHEGRFSALLIPTALPDVQRWQIFAYNAKTERMDSFNIERSADGLFNTRGTRYYTSPDPAHQNDVFERNPGTCPFTNEPLVPIVSKDGYAESALALNGVDESVQIDLTNGEKLPLLAPQPAESTLEVWVKLDAAEPSPLQTLMACGEYSIQYVADSQEFKVSSPVDEVAFAVALADDQFHHLSLIFRAAGSALYLDGQLIEPKMRSEVTGSPTIDPATQLYFGCDRQQTNYLKGVIDEVRIWNRARSPRELTDEMNHRLVGNEPGLVGYWRFDEGAGTTIYDQTDHARHGEFITQAEAVAQRWVKSQAPVGEHPGVRRSSFSFEGRTITAGCSALLYHQQETAATGYNPEEEKPLKRSARVMLAVPTADMKTITRTISVPAQQTTEPDRSIPRIPFLRGSSFIPPVPPVPPASFSTREEQIEVLDSKGMAILDFAVNREGNLAQVPDSLQLEELENTSINDTLDAVSQAESRVDEWRSKIQDADNRINQITEYIEQSSFCSAIARDENRWLFFLGNEASEIADIGSVGITNTSTILNVDGPIDAIASFRQDEFYLFIGTKCLEYDMNKRSQTPGTQIRPITSVFGPQIDEDDIWRTLPSGAGVGNWRKWQERVEQEGIDAAFSRSARDVQIVGSSETKKSWDTFLFKGNLCAWIKDNRKNTNRSSNKWGRIDTRIHSIGLISERFDYFPDDWVGEEGLDAVYRYNDVTFFFKGGEILRWPKGVRNNAVPKPKYYGPEEIAELPQDEQGFLTKLIAFRDALNKKPVSERDNLAQLLPDYESNLISAQEDLDTVNSEIEAITQTSFTTDMPLLLADPEGLTVAGGILGFAASPNSPCLFETVNGRISLYFRGETTGGLGDKPTDENENYFLAAYYDVLAGRATYELPLDETAAPPQIEFTARSTGSAYNGCTITVDGDALANTCTVTLQSPTLGITETWQQVPRHPRRFAEVLNGAAQPTYVGQVTEVSPLADTTELTLTGRGRQTVAAGDVLAIEPSKAKVNVRTVLPEFRGAVLAFDGQNDYIQLGKVEDILPPATDGSTSAEVEDFTVEAWVRIEQDALERDLPILGMDERADNQSLHLTIRGGKPHMGFFGGGNDLTSETPLRPDRWYHLAWRYIRDTGEQAIFINGVLDQAEGDRGSFTGTGNLHIGRWSTPHRYFKGQIGEVRIWNEARTAAEIQTSMVNGITGQERDMPTLVRCWRFAQELEQQAGQALQPKLLAQDYSAQSRNGVVQGQPKLEQVATQATRVEIETPEFPLQKGSTVYRLVYDYDTYATTNRITRSLSQGSLLFRVTAPANVDRVPNGEANSGLKSLSGKWFTDTYGQALNFENSNNNSDGPITAMTQVKFSEKNAGEKQGANLQQFVSENDLTLEAWAKHIAFPRGINRLIHHASGADETSYTLGLSSYGLSPEQIGNITSQYRLFVGVGKQFVLTDPVVSPARWNHLAATFSQAYGLKFDSDRDQVDCGSNITLDLADDLTIEATIRLDDLKEPRGILTKGRMDGSEQGCPYSLSVNTKGCLVLAFQDKHHQNVFLTSPEGFIEAGKTYRIGVTRKKQTETETTQNVDASSIPTPPIPEEWTDVYFFKQTPGELSRYSPRVKYEGTVGSGTGKLILGQADARPQESSSEVSLCHCRGEISEVRLWNTALSKQALGQPLNGREKGLIAWWRFEENEGAFTEDVKGQNHGTITGAEWIKSSDPEASRIRVYVNGNRVATNPWPTSVEPLPQYGDLPQFQLGMGIAQAEGSREHPFLGEMDEIRLWRVARTEEQIQDNLFRRLLGDYQDLIAYYRFDEANTQEVRDHSGQDLRLSLTTRAEGKPFTISTAPISEEAAQVRSALAQARSDFHAKQLASSPAVQEYGDMQYDIDGNLLGVMKRCYSYIEHGQWSLVTGYKVGDLELEWIGQAQYDPQLIGFIEGAPPVPSENLTVRLPDLGQNYENVSVVDLTEAEDNTYIYSHSKENGLDTSLSLQVGAGFKSGTEVGFGMMTTVDDTNVIVGLRGNMETSNSWLSESQVALGKSTSKLSRLAVQGDWEDANRVQYPEMGRRYVPKNVGFALVQSETADMFALRLKHPDRMKQVTVALRMQPNPDIPTDWNIIIFPMNNQYCKQGTLDGRIGLRSDQTDYPNATDYSSDRSYFKPIEAYALKNRIEKEQKELESFYLNHKVDPAGATGLAAGAAAGAAVGAGFGLAGAIPGALIGASVGSAIAGGVASAKGPDLPKLTRRNMFNTYVWTADGGLFAETQQFMEATQEVTAGEFSLSGMAGMFGEFNTAIAKAALSFEMEAMFGGHINLTKTKSKETDKSFGVEVDLDVERDILIATDEQAALVGRPMLDENGDRARCPGKVDGYRFMTFYLEPDKEHFKDFANKVVDRAWLEQSSDPNAAALRQALEKQNGIPWRVLHRVTYVSRVLPEIGTPNAGGTTERLRAANIDSNWELIKRLEPYVKTKTSDYGEFSAAVGQAIDRELPELKGSKDEIIRYMSLYYQVFDDGNL